MPLKNVLEVDDGRADESPGVELLTERNAGDPVTDTDLTPDSDPTEQLAQQQAQADLASILPPFPHPLRHPLKAITWIVKAVFGIGSIFAFLAFGAAIPIVNFVALGYLLEVQRRMAATGRWREVFPLIHLAPRLGMIALGVWVWLLPVRLLGSITADAMIIAPGTAHVRSLQTLTMVVALLVTGHLCLAIARGGSLGCFLRPLKNLLWFIRQMRSGGYLDRAVANIKGFVAGLELRRHFVQGFVGYLAAFLWLALPTALLAAMRRPEGIGVLITIMGGLMLVPVLMWAPYLQTRVLVENRLGACKEVRKVRRLWGHAPWSWSLATILLYAFALPLYLFKVYLLPQDVMPWITLIFVVTMYPAKVLLGWAYHRALRFDAQGHRANFFSRMGARLVTTAVVGVYVFLLFFTQFIGEHGKRVLFEHHALLLPVPF